MQKIDSSIIKQFFGKRSPWSHKGDFGKLLVIGGSSRYSGAPALAGLAALRSGADLVLIAAPRRSADIIASFSPNLITEPSDWNYFVENDVEKILNLVENFDAVVLGSGIGREQKTMNFVSKLVNKIDKPCLIDADALQPLKNRKLRRNFVLTPHSREFFDLTSEMPKNNVEERADLVKKFAGKINCVILLKGHVDVISDGERVALNHTGNPYMTKGGTGDVLSGICGALLARKIEPFKAACAAACISGKAGDLAAKKLKSGLLATDVIDQIPNVTQV